MRCTGVTMTCHVEGCAVSGCQGSWHINEAAFDPPPPWRLRAAELGSLYVPWRHWRLGKVER